MITHVLHILLIFTLGLCLVFALRRGLRRHVGAGSAYALWLLPPIALMAAMLPAWAPMATVRLPVTHVVAGMVRVASVGVDKTYGMATALMLLWLGGTLFSLIALVLRHRQLHRDMRPVPDALHAALSDAVPAPVLARVRVHPAGPAVIWSGRTLLLLPADILARFSNEQRRLILEHERTHMRHGDPWWNLLTELATAVFWFHPLVWLARSRLRLDQELACDDSVLRRHPDATRAYAHTLFHGTGHAGTPVLATWLEEPQLKERLTMIRNLATLTPMRRAGVPVLAALLASSVFGAQAMGAMNDQHVAHPPRTDVSTRQQHPPMYPEYAIKHGLEGMVVLKVKVGTDGAPLAVKPEPGKADASLVKAAVAAARAWRYIPATNAGGQAVTAWAKVPVMFKLGKPATDKGK